MKTIEILAPGGDIDGIKAAINAGASAVYCGVHKFNARNRATNITIDDLNGLLRLAHQHECELFLTLNILILESEIPDLIRLLNKLANTSIDGVIIQDLGLFYLLSRHFKGLDIHASTQLTTHNEGQINFLHDLNASRVNLSRELNLAEIRALSQTAHVNHMLSEVFVHGSYCISYSGLCYMSSVHGGNSGNRGRCSQSCREQFDLTPQGKNFPLNMKDNAALPELKDLLDAGVDSLKIEGRIKQFHYVYTVVRNYKEQLQRIYEGKELSQDKSELYRVFNRDFSAGYLNDDMGRQMFIDNPRDHSSKHLAEKSGDSSDEGLARAEQLIYQEKSELRKHIKEKIDKMSTGLAPLKITASGSEGEVLKMDIITPDSTFSVRSYKPLKKQYGLSLNQTEILKRFKALNETEFFMNEVDVEKLESGLIIPFSDITSMKNRILLELRKGKPHITPVELLQLKRALPPSSPPTLSVLISSENDMEELGKTSAEIYFQLPDAPSLDLHGLLSLFRKNKSMTPWFPPVLVGKDYEAALTFLREASPARIITENTGIAYEAYHMGIPWIAGPRLNLVNSYGLLCLKERFDCKGAFLSNEISRKQIRGIKKPENFDLYYSIYHPMDLMTSRQCFFLGVNGCFKERMDKACLPGCSKSATISNDSKGTLFIEKTKGNYNRIYSEKHFLNLEIVKDMPELFSGFIIDLRKINTSTTVNAEPGKIIELFDQLLKGKADAAQKLKLAIRETSDTPYRVGI